MDSSRYFGSYLKSKRESSGLTQSEVAKKLGYGSSQFISNIERGISSVPIKALKMLIQIYEIDPIETVDALLSEKREKLIQSLDLSR